MEGTHSRSQIGQERSDSGTGAAAYDLTGTWHGLTGPRLSCEKHSGACCEAKGSNGTQCPMAEPEVCLNGSQGWKDRGTVMSSKEKTRCQVPALSLN